MSVTIYYDNLQKLLFRYSDLVEHSNSLGLSNEAVNAENLFCSFLNKAFGWKLINANEQKKNQDSFDLIDKRRGIAIQVTSNKSYTTKLSRTVDSYRRSKKKQKIKHLIILFISRKCPANILKQVKSKEFVYEGYDIPKLLTKLYYQNKHSSELKPLNQILEEATEPVLVNSTYPVTEKPESNETIPAQAISINNSGIYIRRMSLIEDIFSFAQIANGILIGGPGVGKSFTIEELHKYCHKKKIPCFVIRINELLDGRDDELQKEFKVNSYWINALKKIPLSNNDFKALLIFDAFDTAKDERLKSAILKQIRTAIGELKNRWNILVSARTFDAAKSSRLLELFPQINITKSVSCRYFEIPELSELEIDLAAKENKRLYAIVQKCTDELKTLLKIPYFLKLLERIVIDGSNFKNKDLSHIETEEQLLEVYWNTKIANNTSRDIFLRDLTQQLVFSESLSCPKKSVVSDTNSTAFDNLVSLGVIKESSVTKQNISFNHNILLEFAVSKYLIPEDANKLVAFIDEHQKMAFLFRQGFIYFYSKLWQQESTVFWKHYFEIQSNSTPLFRLYHQTILNYILAGYYKDVEDVAPIFSLQDVQESGNTIRKILEAIRFITKGALREKDFLLFLKISEGMQEIFLWEFGYLIDKAIKIVSKSPGSKFMTTISKTSLNYLAFVLEQRSISNKKFLIEANGGIWGIENVCMIFSVHKKSASSKIKEVLELLKEPDFPIRFFYTLSDNLANILKYDRPLTKLIYKTIYYHSENSDKETYLGNSVVLTMRSNRRQDFESIHHKLERDYKVFITAAPEEFIPLGIEIVNKFSAANYYQSSAKPLIIELNGIKSRIVPDYSYSDNDHDTEYGSLSHLEAIFKHIELLVAQHDESRARALLDIVIRKSEVTTVWRRILTLLVKRPIVFKKQAVGLLMNEEFFFCDETVYEAGELIKTIWNHLTASDKKRLERVIFNLSTSKLIKEENEEFKTRRMQRLLSCIPFEELTLIKAKNFVKVNGPVKNKPLVTHGGVRPYHPTDEERIIDIGASSSNDTEFLAYNLIKKLEPFNNKYDHNNSDIPPILEYDPLVPYVDQLFKVCQNSNAFNDKLQFNCDYEVSRFSKLIARNGGKLNKKTRILVEAIANNYIDHPSYISSEYQTGNIKDRTGAYAPTPRTAAVETFVQLLYSDKAGMIGPRILKLISDNIPIVRFKALHVFTFFWQYNRDSFWDKIKERCMLEKDGLCLQRLISNLSYDNIISDNQTEVENAAVALNDSLSNNNDKPADEVWHWHVCLLLRLKIKYNSKTADNLIASNLGIKRFVRQVISEITTIIDPHNKDNNYLVTPDKYDNLINLLHEILVYRFESLKTKDIKNDSGRDDFEIIDNCVQRLYFTIEHGRKENKGGSTTSANKLAFFKKIKPVLTFIVNESEKVDSGFMVAHTGYYFMQLLNIFVDTDPDYALTISASIVKCAAANGFTYDRVTLQEVIKLTEKILADHKELLTCKEHFESLITMLDLFASSGWQEALELTWRLKEVF
ncbi:ATP-binding protein [Foetidibacter luteolus]|uniref:ATP-binding protein n=1 Tax=Foetidibacter luteolus TaxID=2608880 RepID=UPI00129A14BB|nr:ATP-binding protein [Foetidibacter luteolus]